MRILILYPKFPEPDTNAGALRLDEIIRALINQGHRLTLLAGKMNEPRYKTRLENAGVECVCDEASGLSKKGKPIIKFLKDRGFDAAIAVHYIMYARYSPFIRRALPDCRLILDTVDLHALRLERQAETGDSENPGRVRKVYFEEFKAIYEADAVWMATSLERDLVVQMTGRPAKTVHAIPTIHPVSPQNPSYEERAGIVFLGNYKHAPNADAIRYFMNDIYPLMRRSLPEAPLFIAGANPPREFLAYGSDKNARVTGFVEDHRALLSSCRVGIAPLRFGAGIRGKIGEYLGCHLPCVSTSLGAEGMELTPGKDILLADDPPTFAKNIIEVYNESVLWRSLSREGADKIRSRFSPEVVFESIKAALGCGKIKRRSVFSVPWTKKWIAERRAARQISRVPSLSEAMREFQLL
jgi:glycosyltransferase involved in cell wall biosynthesis